MLRLWRSWRPRWRWGVRDGCWVLNAAYFGGAFLATFCCGRFDGVGFMMAAFAGDVVLVEADLAELAVVEVGGLRRQRVP